MIHNPITISLPNAGMIAVIGRRYETLSDDFIQQWMVDLMHDYLVTPDYLLVSEAARHDLYRIVTSDFRMHSWVNQYAYDETGERAERYPNKVTGTPLTLVVFPGLPAKTLFVASALEVVDERVKVQGPFHITTLTYARQNKESGAI